MSDAQVATVGGVRQNVTVREHRNELFAAMVDQVDQIRGSEATDDVVDAVCLALTRGLVEASPSIAHASITVVEQGAVASIAATDLIADLIDQLQGELNEGPCLEAAWTQRQSCIDDYDTETRWKRYTAAVLEKTPVRATHSLELYRDEHSMSALNLHADRSHAFTDLDRSLGEAFAVQVALAIHSVARERQFAAALASRDKIGQAKGILMERYGLGAGAAFEMLRETSQNMNVKVATLAERLVALDHPE